MLIFQRYKNTVRLKLVNLPQIICNSLMTKITIVLVKESTRFILGVNLTSRSDFLVKVIGQNKIQTDGQKD